jgi:hypothetical protein
MGMQSLTEEWRDRWGSLEKSLGSLERSPGLEKSLGMRRSLRGISGEVMRGIWAGVSGTSQF